LTPAPPRQILVVEDNPADIDLTLEAFREVSITATAEVHAVTNGDEALRFVRRQEEFAGRRRPDLVLLDLNLPRKDGREVLAEIKADPDLRRIPVLVLTTSSSTEDVREAYEHHANAYIQKPVGFRDFLAVANSIRDFWLATARLPGE
jgi:two-component system, chemotaxis family, response regulator Rcp1